MEFSQARYERIATAFPGLRSNSSLPNRLRAVFVVLAWVPLFQGCEIVQTAGHGGSIVSKSGEYDCPEDSTCVVKVPAGAPFSDVFTAVPRKGYAFAGWGASHGDLCRGNKEPCLVEITESETHSDGKLFLTAEFYHQPELADPGALAVEWSVWHEEVDYDNPGLRFAADFDGDSDDDVLISGAIYPSGATVPTIVAQRGVILLNNGDFTFSVANGDRPSGVHPREALLADFNGDGMKDLFIADHGYDAPPFPGWSNQLLLWTSEGYTDASDRLPDDSTGFSHNAAVGDVDGDGDIDILVANNGGEFIPGPYFLLNDGAANFTPNTSRLPAALETDRYRAPYAAGIADLDADGHQDLIIGAKGGMADESFIYWGEAGGEFHDDRATALPTPGFFVAFGDGQVISTATHDFNDDGLTDVLLGGYDDGTVGHDPKRGVQMLINAGNRRFSDETQRRLGDSAWSLTEAWHVEHRFFDFNHDGAVDIVPQFYRPEGSNVVAWLNDGTGHYAALKSTAFSDDEAPALWRLAHGVKVRVGPVWKSMEFFGDGATLTSNAAVTVRSAIITKPD